MYDRALLWRATDFWRKGLKPEWRKKIAEYNTWQDEKRALQEGSIEYARIRQACSDASLPADFFQDVSGWFWFVKEDGYLVSLSRGRGAKWSMHTRGGLQLTPPPGFLDGLEYDALPPVMVGELVTGFSGCDTADRGDAGARTVLRNEQFARLHRVIFGGADPAAWAGLRVKVFAFPNTSTSVSKTYDESRVWMEATLHDHPHIGMCRAGELQSTQHALDIFARVVQLGLEGIVIVNPRVRYGAKDYVDGGGDLVGTCFKLKQKIVLPGMEFEKTGRTKDVWKDGVKQVEHEFTTTIGTEVVRFTDQQPRPTGHARIKYMEHAPGLGDSFPCQSGYRHMHFATPEDMSVMVPAKAMPTKDWIVDMILGYETRVGRTRSWDRAEDSETLEKASSAVHLYNPCPFRAAVIRPLPEPEDEPAAAPAAAQPAPAKRRRPQTLAEAGRASHAPDYDPGTHPAPAGGAARARRIDALLRRMRM